MNLKINKLSLFLVCGILFACEPDQFSQVNEKQNIPKLNQSEKYPGGDATSRSINKASFKAPINNISTELKSDFYAGRALAQQPWIKPPTITNARDGLGPIYNARTCLACHKNGGRGKAPRDPNEVLFSTLVRVSIPGADKIDGVIQEPNYGDQIQSQSVSLAHQFRTKVKAEQLLHKEVKPEAYPYLEWKEEIFTYTNGKKVKLSKPTVVLKQLNYGELHPKVQIGLRVAPPLLGMGLLGAIKQTAIDQLADPEDKNKDGISGRVNQVWDFNLKETRAGRFGLKSNKPDLYNLTAAAFANDIGISNPLFPYQPCTKFQKLCLETPNGNDPIKNKKEVDENKTEQVRTEQVAVELPKHLLKLTTDFVSQLTVPARRNFNKSEVRRGRNYFYQVGCQSCHQPSFTTGKSEIESLSGQVIWPYTDLLLHDMGSALADGRSDYQASGNEWRTPPLWGVGLSEEVNGNQNYLHDGRAKTIEEAILWHGGEASKVQHQFTQLTQIQRENLIAFVKSL